MSDNSDIEPDVQPDIGDSLDNPDMTPDNDRDIEEFECSVCGDRFDNERSVEMHSLSTHHDPNAWKTGEEKTEGSVEEKADTPRGDSRDSTRYRRSPSARSHRDRGKNRWGKYSPKVRITCETLEDRCNEDFLNDIADEFEIEGFSLDKLGEYLYGQKSGIPQDWDKVNMLVNRVRAKIQRYESRTRDRGGAFSPSRSSPRTTDVTGDFKDKLLLQLMNQNNNSSNSEIKELRKELRQTQQDLEKQRHEAEEKVLEKELENLRQLLEKQPGKNQWDALSEAMDKVGRVGERYVSLLGQMAGESRSIEEAPERSFTEEEGEAYKERLKDVPDELILE